jgi:hypothetical protein
LQYLGKTMQPKLVKRDRSASALGKGDLADEWTIRQKPTSSNAVKEGMIPGSNGYAAFIIAFARRVHSKQASPGKKRQETEKAVPTRPLQLPLSSRRMLRAT